MRGHDAFIYPNLFSVAFQHNKVPDFAGLRLFGVSGDSNLADYVFHLYKMLFNGLFS